MIYEDKMTQATWNVNRAPTQGLGKFRGRLQFEVNPERRGDDTRVRVTFEEQEEK